VLIEKNIRILQVNYVCGFVTNVKKERFIRMKVC
jgi:hypothetical protein